MNSSQVKLKKMKPHQLRAELEATLQQLNTQIVVSRQLEHERDKAYDDYEYTKVSLNIYTHQSKIQWGPLNMDTSLIIGPKGIDYVQNHL
jgi:hypothetical protein